MTRYIDADKVVDAIKSYGKRAIDNNIRSLDPIDDIIEIVKTIDYLAEVKHGEWKQAKDGDGLVCSGIGGEGERSG